MVYKANRAGPIYPCRVAEGRGNISKMLAKEEHPRGGSQKGKDDRKGPVGPAKTVRKGLQQKALRIKQPGKEFHSIGGGLKGYQIKQTHNHDLRGHHKGNQDKTE